MPVVNPVRRLLSSFKPLGLSAAQVRRLMPEWWEDEAAESEGGLLELQILLARRLNVTLQSLQLGAPQPTFKQSTQRFKTIHPEGSNQLAVAAGIGSGLAKLLANACSVDSWPSSLDAQDIRAQILGEGSPAVTLDQLCQWLWRSGIPVLHITGWPEGLRRPDAMCMSVNDRPVIMVIRKELAPPKLAYLVAHEIGHVMSGHLGVGANAVLVDDTLPVDNQNSFFDQDEEQADIYAMELLGGQRLYECCKRLSTSPFTESGLAVAALDAAKGEQIDAGQIILGWGRLTQDWKTANLALRFVLTTSVAPVVINDIAKKFMDRSLLPEDGIEHISQLTGMKLG